MDKQISKKRKIIKKVPFIIILILAGIILPASYGKLIKKPAMTINKNIIRTTIVKKGDFKEYYEIYGEVKAQEVYDIYNTAPGLVVKSDVKVDDGVTKNSLLFTLGNTQLDEQKVALQREYEDSEIQKSGIEQSRQSERILLRDELLNKEYSYNDIRIEFEQMEELKNTNIYSRAELEKKKRDLDYLKNKVELQKQKITVSEEQYIFRLKQLEKRQERIYNDLQKINEKISKLKITAPVSGFVNSIFINEGQNCPAGTLLAQMSNPELMCITATISNVLVEKIYTGMDVLVKGYTKEGMFPLSSKSRQMVDKQIEIRVNLPKKHGLDIILGSSAVLQLISNSSENAIIIPRGQYFPISGGRWVFVINKSDNTAEKRLIEIGKTNTNEVEVLSGLSAGEEIIISSYADFEDIDKILIQ